jgi:hypothetical protein
MILNDRENNGKLHLGLGGSEDETMANLWEYKVKRIIIVSVFKNTTSTRIEVTLPY